MTVRYWWKKFLKVLAAEASKGYKKENQRENDRKICTYMHN